MSKGPQDLSLAEKLEHAIRQLGFWYRISIIIVLVGLAALSGIISMSQFYFHDEVSKYGHIEEIFVEDAPLWFFNYNKAILAHQPWVHGLAAVAPEMMFQDMTSVWIDETSPRANMK